jgi:hypothetical protein
MRGRARTRQAMPVRRTRRSLEWVGAILRRLPGRADSTLRLPGPTSLKLTALHTTLHPGIRTILHRILTRRNPRHARLTRYDTSGPRLHMTEMYRLLRAVETGLPTHLWVEREHSSRAKAWVDPPVLEAHPVSSQRLMSQIRRALPDIGV